MRKLRQPLPTGYMPPEESNQRLVLNDNAVSDEPPAGSVLEREVEAAKKAELDSQADEFVPTVSGENGEEVVADGPGVLASSDDSDGPSEETEEASVEAEADDSEDSSEEE